MAIKEADVGQGVNDMKLEEALPLLRADKKICRSNTFGPHDYLFMGYAIIQGCEDKIMHRNYFGTREWQPRTSDLLADDWELFIQKPIEQERP